MDSTRNVFLTLVAAAVVLGGIWYLSHPPGHASAIASGHPEWPPIMFQNGSSIDGVGPALVAKIFSDMGVPVTFPASGSWAEVQDKAKSGEVDVLVAAYKTSERETYMDYSDAYTTDPIVLFVAKGKAFPFKEWGDLGKKKGVAMVGDSYGQAFDDFSKTLDLKRVETSQEAFATVASSTADYFIYSLYAGDVALKDAGMLEAFESLPMHVAEENFYVTVSKKSPFAKYLPQINAGIAKYKADGTIDALLAQFKSQ